jgi:hypothetical protein
LPENAIGIDLARKSHAMKPLIIVALLLSLFVTASAQEPDRWHGLTLDHGTTEDAIKLFGKPKADRVSPLSAVPIESWVSNKRKQKVFRTLEYKNPASGVERVWLFFLDDRLISVMLDMKEGTVSPNALSSIYGAPFRPIFDPLTLALSPRDFQRDRGEVYARSYPVTYHLASVTERSFVTAMVVNSVGVGKMLGLPDRQGSFPGKVAFVQLISRTMENRDGSDALR